MPLPALLTIPAGLRNLAVRVALALLAALCQAWRAHRALLLGNAAYAATVATAAAAAARQTSCLDVLIALLLGADAIRRVLRRDLTPL